jgi:hypothetical protein
MWYTSSTSIQSAGQCLQHPRRGQPIREVDVLSLPQSRFYVYVLTDPDDAPFYVGKGSGRRVFEHTGEARGGCECYKCRVIRKIWREGQEYGATIVFATDDEYAAFAKERELIAAYGRENLCNLTDGGEGASGRMLSEDTKRKIGDANRGRPGWRKGMKAPREWAEKIANALRGRKRTPEQNERNRQANLGKKLSPETIEKQRQRMMGNTYGVGKRSRTGQQIPEEQRRRISETLKAKAPWRGKSHTEESIARMSEVQRQRHEERPQYIYTLTSPDGEIFTTGNLGAWCKEHGWHYSGARSTALGGGIYQGWTISRAGQASTRSEQTRRKISEAQTANQLYEITTPDGAVFEVSSLTAFCETYGLNYRSVVNGVSAGRKHKGWLIRKKRP